MAPPHAPPPHAPPPHSASSPGIALPGIVPPQPGVMVSPGAVMARPGSHAELPDESTPAPRVTPVRAARTTSSGVDAAWGDPQPAPVQGRDSAQALPPPPTPDAPENRSLLNALAPGPAAARRAPLPSEPRDGDGRRRSDQAPPVAGRSPLPAPSPYPTIPRGQFDDDFNTTSDARSIEVEAAVRLGPSGVTPPSTRVQLREDRPFTPPKVSPVPEIPEPGLYSAARYSVRFVRARWQRRGAIRTLQNEIKQDTEALDQVLGALGRVARTARVDGRVFSAENNAINAAEERMGVLGKEHGDVDGRKAEENSKFVDVERERNAKLSEAERMVEEVQKELAHLDGQRRAMRDKRKELERRQRAYLKSAEDNDKQAGSAQMGESRGELRRSAEQYRKEAAALEPDRQEVDRRLAGLERPIGEGTAKLDTAKAELDAAKRSLSDAREGHNHRLAELDAEQKRKSREIAQAEAEVTRRLVTLGTLVNLNRIDDPQFAELYQRIDRLRSAITSRTTEIEKLNAEREAYDRGTLIRGGAAIGGAIVLLIALIVILGALL